MDIYELMKDGRTVEEIRAAFEEAIASAQLQYEQYMEEQERLKRERVARELEEACRKQRLEEARGALGNALIEYFSALDSSIDEAMYETVDWLIDALPYIKVVKARGGFW